MNFISYISTRRKNSCKYFGFTQGLIPGGVCGPTLSEEVLEHPLGLGSQRNLRMI